jgi:trans-aconitate methyltransferase
MEINEAAEMLKNLNKNSFKGKNEWADLGCGSGTFTMALATLLEPESIIYAIDKNAASLHQIPTLNHNVKIEKKKMDFINQTLDVKNLDGILMANALHYVKDKTSFINKLIECINLNGCFLVVEYETKTPVSNWVPFPINFSDLKKTFHDSGFKNIQKLHERKSIYGQMMYSAFIEK